MTLLWRLYFQVFHCFFDSFHKSLMRVNSFFGQSCSFVSLIIHNGFSQSMLFKPLEIFQKSLIV
jgi:hypothetical protein